MLSSRNLAKGLSKYMTPKTVAVPFGKLEYAAPVEVAVAETYTETKVSFGKKSVISNMVAKNQVVPGLPNLQKRYSHTDIPNPDFNFYRREGTKSIKSSSNETDTPRRAFTYVIAGGLGVAGVAGGKHLVQDILSTLSASADVLAVSKVEVNLAEIPVGKNVVVKWRGKPLFVRHRTEEEIAETRAVDVNSLRDPERDEDRTKHPNYLITLGVCTHLGCVPIANAGDFGGYYCPCHGSHYDGSGRIRKGPAPTNLEVPEYNFIDDSTVVVG